MTENKSIRAARRKAQRRAAAMREVLTNLRGLILELDAAATTSKLGLYVRRISGVVSNDTELSMDQINCVRQALGETERYIEYEMDHPED